jgi:glucose-6-phosphate 1-dehydrogenase
MTRIFLFGATGNLSLKKIYPAFYALLNRNLLPKDVEIICIGRRDFSNLSFQDFVTNRMGVEYDVKKWVEFIKLLEYYQLNFDAPKDYMRLKRKILVNSEEVDLFYLATDPQFFKPITRYLAESGMLQYGNLNKRIVFEKPFGKNLETATKINEYLSEYVVEDQIYRMDHYLGKEMIQNIMMLRFSNMIYEASWNREYIDHVQIIVTESVGVLERAGYYDQSGAIRDMIQSHLLQMLTLVAMTPKGYLDTEDVIKGKTDVLKAISIADVKTDVVIGQYIGANEMQGYREETGVSPESCTETFAALKVKVDQPRWKDVDFYLKTGKRLSEKKSEIIIEYKEMGENTLPDCPKNMLVIEIYPREGMRLKFNMKMPGTTQEIVTREMEFCQSCILDYNAPEAYEILINEVLNGKHDLYTRWDEVKYEWAFVERILSECTDRKDVLQFYPAGSQGPELADELLKRDGRSWYLR